MEIKVCGMRETANIRDLIQLPIDYIGFIFYDKSARYVELIPDLKDSKRFQEIKKVGVFVNADIDFVLEKIKEFDLNIIQLHGKETPQYVRELSVKILKLTPKYLELLSKIDLIKNDIDISSSSLNKMEQVFLINKLKISTLIEKNVKYSQSKTAAIINDLALEQSKLAISKRTLERYSAKLNIIESEINKIRSEFEIWKVFSIDDTFDFNETKPYEDFADKFLFDTKTPQHGGSGQKFNWDLLNNYTGQTPFFLSGGISASDTEGVKNIKHPQFWGLDVNSKFETSPALKDTRMLHKFLFGLGKL